MAWTLALPGGVPALRWAADPTNETPMPEIARHHACRHASDSPLAIGLSAVDSVGGSQGGEGSEGIRGAIRGASPCSGCFVTDVTGDNGGQVRLSTV